MKSDGGGRCFERKEKKNIKGPVWSGRWDENEGKSEEKDAGAPFLGETTAAGMKVCMGDGVK